MNHRVTEKVFYELKSEGYPCYDSIIWLIIKFMLNRVLNYITPSELRRADNNILWSVLLIASWLTFRHTDIYYHAVDSLELSNLARLQNLRSNSKFFGQKTLELLPNFLSHNRRERKLSESSTLCALEVSNFDIKKGFRGTFLPEKSLLGTMNDFSKFQNVDFQPLWGILVQIGLQEWNLIPS